MLSEREEINMKLSDMVDLNVIQKIQDQFSDATGLAIVTVDLNGNCLTKESNVTDFFMKYIKKNKEDAEHYEKPNKEGNGVYFSDMGMLNFFIDILYDGEKVASMVGGQVLAKEPDLEEFRARARELGVNETDYINAAKKLPVRSEKSVKAAAAFLEMTVNRAVNSEYFKTNGHKKMATFDEEMKNSLNAIKGVKDRTKDLQGIASKENILSLNASIEASRVGQAGAGFAVVAKEIGELSKRSSHVYNEIQELVNVIEKSVKNMSKTE